ncbi:MAG: hypothetical protein ACK5V3_16845 [Bdellovibrionales bacterium]
MANDKEDKHGLGEALKKVFSVGVSAAFMTEEGIRKYLADLKLPKEILEALLAGANRSKDEITQRVAKEINGIISKIDWVQELSKFAETHKFKIKAEIEIEKKN